MAETLAVLHWSVQIDARDVELVLGARRPPSSHCPPVDEEEEEEDMEALAPNTSISPARALTETLFLGEPVQVWLLDFNQCRLSSSTTKASPRPSKPSESTVPIIRSRLAIKGYGRSFKSAALLLVARYCRVGARTWGNGS